MIAMLGTLELAALAALCFAVLTSAVCAALFSRVQRSLASVGPAARARLLLAWAAAPALAAVTLTALCFVPSFLGVIGLGPDHCLSHDDRHAHFCLVHPAAGAGGTLGWALLGGAMAWASFGVAKLLLAVVRARRLLRSLPVAKGRSLGREFRVVDSAIPVSMAAGILRPEVFVSSGLMRSCSAEVLGVVLEHERAHVLRRDGLRKLAAAVLSLAHFPGTRLRSREDLALACEQACDERAAERVGDRLRVAEAILAVERTVDRAPPGLGFVASAFGGSNVAARVEALLGDPLPPPSANLRRTSWIALGIGLLLAEPLHHVTETLIGLIAS